MTPGAIVIYGHRGPLSHVLAGCPGVVREAGLVEFNRIARPVDPGDVSPALLWWRKGAGRVMGPYPDAVAALEALRLVCSAPGPDLERLAARVEIDPDGAEIVSHGWRFRLLWGGMEPPARFDV